ncbi:MAG: outer membrane protein transport protein [Bradymonadales bacterium]|nr:outer membrane protein transport protein [Bradymonadales bacterium]
MNKWSPSSIRPSCWLICAVVLLVSSTALAGGFTIPLVGARMSGQAAFGAHPDDTSAIYHNPAGLILVDGLRLELSGTGILTNTAYSRVDYPQIDGTGEFDTSRPPSGLCPPEGASEGYDGDGYVLEPCYRPEAAPASPFGIIPFGGISYRLNAPRLAFGLGVYSPHNATAAFPEDGAQRYSVIEGSITTVYLTPTVAWQPHPFLALGAGLSVVRANARLDREYWIPEAFHTWNPDPVILSLEAEGWSWGYNAGLILYPGALLSPLEGLEIAASYTSRASLEFDGQIEVGGLGALLGGVFEPGYQEGQTIERDATAEFTIPDMLRLSLGYAFGAVGWVGVDLYWNHYSLYDKLTIRLKEPLGTLQEFTEPKDSTESWSLGVGGRWRPIDALDARLGVFLDQSPYPDNTYTVLSPDSDKLGITTGLSWRPGWGFELTGAYMLLLFADRVVDDSLVRPEFNFESLHLSMQAPFSANGEVVGKVVHVFGLQLGWSWEPAGERTPEVEPEPIWLPDWAEDQSPQG